MKENDLISKIITLLDRSSEPLETKEIENHFPKESRTKILYRLNRLRGDRLIEGKVVGSGKGTWIWWKKNAIFERDVPRKDG